MTVDAWPLVPRAGLRTVTPGDIVTVRTRRGPRRLRVRVIRPAERIARRFVVGDSRRGWCHAVWLDDIVSIKP